MSTAVKQCAPFSDQTEKDIFKNFPDWYLKPLIEEGLAAANAGKMTDGNLVFKRLREKFSKKYNVAM